MVEWADLPSSPRMVKRRKSTRTRKGRARQKTLTDFTAQLAEIYDEPLPGLSDRLSLSARGSRSRPVSMKRGHLPARSKSRKFFELLNSEDSKDDVLSSGMHLSLIQQSSTTDASPTSDSSDDTDDDSDDFNQGGSSTTKIHKVMWAEDSGSGSSSPTSPSYSSDDGRRKGVGKKQHVIWASADSDDLQVSDSDVDSGSGQAQRGGGGSRHVMFDSSVEPPHKRTSYSEERPGLPHASTINRVGFDFDLEPIQSKVVTVLNPSSECIYVRVRSMVPDKGTEVLDESEDDDDETEEKTESIAATALKKGSAKKKKKSKKKVTSPKKGKKGGKSKKAKVEETPKAKKSESESDPVAYLLKEGFSKVPIFGSREFGCETRDEGVYLSAVLVSKKLAGACAVAEDSTATKKGGAAKKGKKKAAAKKAPKKKKKKRGAASMLSVASLRSPKSKPTAAATAIGGSLFISDVLLSDWLTTQSVFEFDENEMSVNVCSMGELKKVDTAVFDKLVRSFGFGHEATGGRRSSGKFASTPQSASVADEFRVFKTMAFDSVLTEMKLKPLIKMFASEVLTQVADWRFLTKADLSAMGVKKGQVLAFVRERNALFGVKMRAKATMKQLLWEFDELVSMYIANPEMIDDYPVNEGLEFVNDIRDLLRLHFSLDHAAATAWVECVKTHELLVASKLRIVYEMLAESDEAENSDVEEGVEVIELPYLDEDDFGWCYDCVADFCKYLEEIKKHVTESDDEFKAMRTKIEGTLENVHTILKEWFKLAKSIETDDAKQLKEQTSEMLELF